MPRMKLNRVLPMAYAPVLALETYARKNNDKRLYELIKIRASQLNRCHYCIALHSRDALRGGETRERVEALAGDWRQVEVWTEAEAAALAFTDEVTRLGEGGVSDAVWDDAVRHFGQKGTGHLIMAVAAINVWNRIGIATGLTAADL